MRPPDFTVGNYLQRWWIIPRNNWANIYLHRFIGSDEDRALHDHMYFNISLVLSAGYWEHIHGRRVWRRPGSVVFRLPSTPHRIELGPRPAMSLFLTGPRVREWGFHCPKGWVHWRDFVPVSQGGKNLGCE